MYEVQSESSRTVLVVLFVKFKEEKSKLCTLVGKTFFYTTIFQFILYPGFPRYREFGKGPGISKTVFPVMKSPGICNFHNFSVNRPGIWFTLEMSGPERSVRFKAANK